MNYLIYIVATLILVRFLNQYRVKLSTIETQNKLEELKHEVTINYLNGKISSDKYKIDEFKNLISETEIVLYRLNLWAMLYTWKITNVDDRIRGIQEYNKEVERCPELSKSYNKFSEISSKYMFNKTIFSLVTIGIAVFIGKHISSRCTRFIIRVKDSIKYNLIFNNNITPTT